MGPVAELHSSSLLESLPARPPTPPRETVDHDLDALPKQLNPTLRSLQTPPGFLSPSSSSKDSTVKQRKRVGFSSQAQYQEPPKYVDPSSRRQQATPVSRPASTSRPAKGILKPTAIPNRLGPTPGQDDLVKPGQTNFAEMLESTLQQLAGADRESKIDAYTMLFRGLKASSNLPDRIALQQKLDLFLQFIQRDLASNSSTGSIDAILVTPATKLLHIFLRHQGIASGIPNEFGVFLVDHCIRSLREQQAPKEVLRHLMHALFLQHFNADVMTADRVGRLVEALHDVERHMTGKSILKGRIWVYYKLVKQCPQQMAIHSDWLQDLFTDMMSSAVEIRSAAIRLGLNAAFTLNQDKRLVSRALDLLNLGLEDKKYVEHITERLLSMLQSTEDCVYVPRIWSAITLFIPKPESWNYFKPWTVIVQSCFNHTNLQVRKEANLAWCRYTYRLFLDGSLGAKRMITLIPSPLLDQLTNRRKPLRESVMGGIRNLLYYACRPDVDLKTLDDVWDLAIAPLVQRLTAHAQEGNTNIADATALLSALIRSGTRRLWNQKRIADPALIKDEELPALDPRWIRVNSVRVLALAAPLLEKRFAELSVLDSQTRRLWQALVDSVAFASAKDVKLHDDTAKFVAEAFTFFISVWKTGPTSALDGKSSTSSRFLDSSRHFILILVQGLGLLPNPFMDKTFTRSKEDKFSLHTASTSHRSAKYLSTRRPPLHHLFAMLSQVPSGIEDDDALVQYFESTFSPFFKEKSINAQAEFARQLLRLLPTDVSGPSGPWVWCATKILASLETGQASVGSGSAGNLGPELREITKLLERGLRSCPAIQWERWMLIFHPLLSYVKNETGVAGIALAVVEPLAMMLKDLIVSDPATIATNVVCATIELVKTSTQPRDKLAVDAARRRLWGTLSVGPRQTSFDPFDNLYKLLVIMLGRSYTDLASCRSEKSMRLLTEVTKFFDRGNPRLVLRALIGIQDSVAPWLEDKDHRLTRTDHPGTVEAIVSLWKTLCGILLVPAAELQLDTVEPLFCAAFRSTHRQVVGLAVAAWNQIYEHVDNIQYPETLKNVLQSLGSSVDVIRPGLEINDDDSNKRLGFTESQNYGNHPPFISSAQFQPTSILQPPTPRLSTTPGSAKTAETHSVHQDSTSSARINSKGRTPKAKLRHEDSQMQFTAVDFSPAPMAQESQLLTDRQKEIRERQRETAAMFPALRSSPTTKTKKAQSNTAQQMTAPSASFRASTPQHDGRFDDCLTSTPTPRRGQSAPLPEQDHEMTDPPSSPPEPRSFRLLAELKSQAKKLTPMDDWHFTSSPISGSPNPGNPATLSNCVSQAMELDEVDGQLRSDGEDGVDETTALPDAGLQQDVLSSQLDLVEDTMMYDPVSDADLPAAVDAKAHRGTQVMTRSQKSRPQGLRMTPKCDDEEFVGARSSPMPPTPSQRFDTAGSPSARAPLNTANNESFNISASFENGLRNVGTAKIEISLRSSQLTTPRKKEFTAYEHILPESPEPCEARLALQEVQPKDAAEILDVIEVTGAENDKRGRGRSKKSRSAPASRESRHSRPPSLNTQLSKVSQGHIPSTPIEELVSCQGNFDNVSPGSGRWWRKRKRSISSSVFSSGGGSKKARHDEILVTESVPEEIPDSQPVLEAAADHEYAHVEMQTAQDLAQCEVSSVSYDGNSFAEHTMASQELPTAADDAPFEGSQPSPRADEEFVQEPRPGLPCQPEPEPEGDVSQEHTDYIEEETANCTDDEQAVHSQLAREEEDAACRSPSPARVGGEQAAPVQQSIAPLNEGEVDTAPLQEISMREQDAPEPGNRLKGLIDMLRGGLDILRTTDLSREQVYEVEDLMYELRRELHQAERRGRE